MRRRVVLAILGVAALSVGLFALPLALVLHRSYRDEELIRLERDAIAAARTVDLGGQRHDPPELPAFSGTLSVYGRGGQRVAGRGPTRSDRLVRDTLRQRKPSVRAGDGLLLVAVPLLVGEEVRGVLRAARDDGVVARRTRRAWAYLAGLALVVLALAGAAAVGFGRRLARPLELLAGAARRLGEGDFAARAPRFGVPEADAVAADLDVTAERLGDLVGRERAFSADASHQLRTPLAALRLELEALALREEQETPELTAALAQVDRLGATVETLLGLARDMPAGDMTTDLDPLLDALENRWRGTLAARGRALRVVHGAHPSRARVRASALAEILEVLLDNAARHGAGTVRLAMHRRPGWLVVDVEDEGSGLEGDGEGAFARRTSSGTGHGIGLSLARSLAHAEGGRLEVARAAPAPCFRLTLPAA